MSSSDIEIDDIDNIEEDIGPESEEISNPAQVLSLRASNLRILELRRRIEEYEEQKKLKQDWDF